VDIQGQIKSFKKKNHLKPLQAYRPYSKLFETNTVEHEKHGYLVQVNVKSNNTEEVEEVKKPSFGEIEIDLTKTYTTLPSRDVTFIN